MCPKTKVNATYYIDKFLRPIIEDELPVLFPGEMNKVFIHHEKASSYISKQTMTFLTQMREKYAISFECKEEIVVEGADVSPVDFNGFGWLINKVETSKYRTIGGFCKIIREEWSKLSKKTCENVFNACKIRCRVVANSDGAQQNIQIIFIVIGNN